MADRKAELERKKERLRQMREEKERRRKEKEKQVMLLTFSNNFNLVTLFSNVAFITCRMSKQLPNHSSESLLAQVGRLPPRQCDRQEAV